MNITAKELQEMDPKRFEKEYYKWLEHACDYDWYDYTFEDFKERGKTQGFDVEDVQFSLGYSQSDYASWDGGIDVLKWVSAQPDANEPKWFTLIQLVESDAVEVSCSVSTRGFRGSTLVNLDWRYVLEGTVGSGPLAGADAGELFEEVVGGDEAMGTLENALQGAAESFASDMYEALRDEYEHLTSEEQFIEDCECNDVTFEVEEEDE